MPQRVELIGQIIDIEKGVAPVVSEGNGQPVMEDMWRIIATDRQTGDCVWFAINRELRDIIVQKLTGGIVLAGGELPKLP